ncbi:probable aspartic proteinase GIP2 [Argentina anserina]|uniref:probable aspartic proteinase GIP2 n=1 Tax=Argentina anserina TaxID=57926 RepID=UPI00217682D5|nr:probable aspartic proteinase GIP2 [Potentilla anserina]
MASSSFQCLILLSSLAFFFFATPSLARTSFKPKALVLPVTKDPSTLQYLTAINQRTPLVPVKLTVDLGGQSLWVDCEGGYVSSTYKPAHCGSSQCKLAESKSCTTECFSSPKPGCNNNTCNIFPDNPLATTLTGSGELGQDVVALRSTDGSKPGPVVSTPNVLFSCGDTSLLANLSAGVKGMAGLGRPKVGLPSQLAYAFSLDRKFAICLPSTSKSKGVIFFGRSPYVFLPGIDVSKSLTYTKLILNPVSTAGVSFEGDASSEYFIGVNSIKVNEKMVPFNTSLLAIDGEGFGGTRISTLKPYTVLETSIYKAVVNAFVKSLAHIPRVKSVAPFGACYDSKKIGSTRVGPGVPAIDLVLSNGVYWRVFGANSMVQVSKDVLCLGFVDGGVRPRTSIVIGGHQIEDNLLQFDLANKRLGFSSSLLFRQTTCANFNFTS